MSVSKNSKSFFQKKLSVDNNSKSNFPAKLQTARTVFQTSQRKRKVAATVSQTSRTSCSFHEQYFKRPEENVSWLRQKILVLNRTFKLTKE